MPTPAPTDADRLNQELDAAATQDANAAADTRPAMLLAEFARTPEAADSLYLLREACRLLDSGAHAEEAADNVLAAWRRVHETLYDRSSARDDRQAILHAIGGDRILMSMFMLIDNVHGGLTTEGQRRYCRDEIANAAARLEAAIKLADTVYLPAGYGPVVDEVHRRITRNHHFGGIFELNSLISKAGLETFSAPEDKRPSARVVGQLIDVRYAIDSLPWPKSKSDPTISRICSAVAGLKDFRDGIELVGALQDLAHDLQRWLGEDGIQSNQSLAGELRNVLEAALRESEKDGVS